MKLAKSLVASEDVMTDEQKTLHEGAIKGYYIDNRGFERKRVDIARNPISRELKRNKDPDGIYRHVGIPIPL